MRDRYFGGIDGGDVPAEVGEVDGVASGAAGEVEGTAGRKGVGEMDEEGIGGEVEVGGVGVVSVPVAGHSG